MTGVRFMRGRTGTPVAVARGCSPLRIEIPAVADGDSRRSVLLPDDVRCSGALGGGLDIELDLRSLREILATDVLHVEEDVFVVVEVAVVSRDETVTARVVEEFNLTVSHYDHTYGATGDNRSESRVTTAPPNPLPTPDAVWTDASEGGGPIQNGETALLHERANAHDATHHAVNGGSLRAVGRPRPRSE